MSSLPSVYQEVHYVYTHIDPRTQEVVYVGKGQQERAWLCRGNQRKPEHVLWINELFNQGYTMADIVHIEYSNLTSTDAFSIETDIRDNLKPKFNKELGKSLLIITPDDLDTITKYRELGKSYQDIADDLGYSTMTVYRAFNKQMKGYK